jgi:hypothetical protein
MKPNINLKRDCSGLATAVAAIYPIMVKIYLFSKIE